MYEDFNVIQNCISKFHGINAYDNDYRKKYKDIQKMYLSLNFTSGKIVEISMLCIPQIISLIMSLVNTQLILFIYSMYNKPLAEFEWMEIDYLRYPVNWKQKSIKNFE